MPFITQHSHKSCIALNSSVLFKIFASDFCSWLLFITLKPCYTRQFSYNLQRNNAETLQAALDMLHAASQRCEKIVLLSYNLQRNILLHCMLHCKLRKWGYTGNYFRNLQRNVCCVTSCRKNCLVSHGLNSAPSH